MSLPCGDLSDAREQQPPSLCSGESWPEQSRAEFVVCCLLKKINLCS